MIAIKENLFESNLKLKWKSMVARLIIYIFSHSISKIEKIYFLVYLNDSFDF
jgi:hypothetical protein